MLRAAPQIAGQMRHYSSHLPNDHSKIKGLAATGYVVAAFTLPFVPPYIASRKAERDGTFETRPPIKWCYRCP